VFPNAQIEPLCAGYGSVKIVNVETNATIAEVAQRDLFRKYRWPAADGIKQKLQLFKETMEE